MTQAETNALDAARFRYLQRIDAKIAQSFFWHFKSRKERAKAIDTCMAIERGIAEGAGIEIQISDLPGTIKIGP